MFIFFGIPCTYDNYRKENFPPKISINARWFSLVFLITNHINEGKLPLGYLQNLGQMLRDSRIDKAIKFKQIIKYVEDLKEQLGDQAMSFTGSRTQNRTELYIKAKNQFLKCDSMCSLANSTCWLSHAFRETTGHTIMIFMWHTGREESVVQKMVLSRILIALYHKYLTNKESLQSSLQIYSYSNILKILLILSKITFHFRPPRRCLLPTGPNPILPDLGTLYHKYFTYKNLCYRFRERFRVIHMLSSDNSVLFKIFSLPLIFGPVVFWASIGQDPCHLRLQYSSSISQISRIQTEY